jgi:hypothetical protein
MENLTETFKYLSNSHDGREPSVSSQSSNPDADRQERLKRARLKDQALGVFVFYPSRGGRL